MEADGQRMSTYHDECDKISGQSQIPADIGEMGNKFDSSAVLHRKRHRYYNLPAWLGAHQECDHKR
jgi:hypothetical protein